MAVLLLNASMQPLNVISHRRLIVLLTKERVAFVDEAAQLAAAEAVAGRRLPQGVVIVRLLRTIHVPRRLLRPNRRNLLLRDDHTCQYCGIRGEKLMTVDHVVPKSRGGPSTWENLVCACMRCNNRKNNRTPDECNLTLKKKPRQPKYIPWIQIKRNTLPDEWGKFLFLYNVSIEERVE